MSRYSVAAAAKHLTLAKVIAEKHGCTVTHTASAVYTLRRGEQVISRRRTPRQIRAEVIFRVACGQL